MIACRHAEGVHGQRKVGKPCPRNLDTEPSWLHLRLLCSTRS